ncbi:MAG: helix-turn-helix domain-containing protein [Lachnospiraceae bacterium]|nr:helix-turn-helix domain-containing protein [Lachnospiraceae bacterium]
MQKDDASFDFLLRCRIEQSLTLLQNNDLSITDIAIQVGFSGPSYYAEVFKRYMLCSPTAYRKKHLQKTNSEN